MHVKLHHPILRTRQEPHQLCNDLMIHEPKSATLEIEVSLSQMKKTMINAHPNPLPMAICHSIWQGALVDVIGNQEYDPYFSNSKLECLPR